MRSAFERMEFESFRIANEAIKLTTPTFQEKTKYLCPKVSKGRSESPLVGRWGKAPYLKMLRYLFPEMFGLSLTVPQRS